MVSEMRNAYALRVGVASHDIASMHEEVKCHHALDFKCLFECKHECSLSSLASLRRLVANVAEMSRHVRERLKPTRASNICERIICKFNPLKLRLDARSCDNALSQFDSLTRCSIGCVPF